MMKGKILVGCLVGFVSLFTRADFEVYFLRHGETTWNRARLLQGSVADTRLTPKGEAMAVASAEGMVRAGLSFDRVYSSPYLRAWRTAELVAEKGGFASPVRESRLREMCFGRYEGVKYEKGKYVDDNLRKFFVGEEGYEPQGEGAESFAEVQARVRDFLERELKPLDGKVTRVLCVAHSLVLKSLVRELAGDAAPASAKQTLQRNCCVHVVKYADGKFTLRETGRIFYDAAAFDAACGPQMVAHRGAGDLTMPEASRPAYSNAVALANDIVKLDLQETKDGVIVMGHDPTLKRNMGWDKKIVDLTYAEILAQGTFKAKGGYAHEKIVRLDEALAIVKPAPEFWIDFKRFTPDFAEKVLTEFRKAGIDESRIMIATFTRPALAYFQQKHPAIRRVGHIGEKQFKEGVGSVLAYRDKYGLWGVNMPVAQKATKPEDVKALRANGLWVSLWFVQDAATAASYRGAEPDAFVTDHVSVVRPKAGARWSCELVGEPTVICRGPTWEKAGWGPYQFPVAYPLGDGRVAVSVFVSKDDFTHYGDPCRWFVTADGGTTWQETSPKVADKYGILLPNGDRVSFPLESSPELKGYSFTSFAKRLPDGKWRAPGVGKRFPVPDGVRGDMFGGVAFAYLAERVPEEFREANWLVRRLKAGADEAVAERAKVEWPYFTRVVHARGNFSGAVLKTVSPKCKAKVGPDGALWVSTFSGEGHVDPETKLYSPYYSAEIFRSEDGGRTFARRSHIAYRADGVKYPYASGGFSDNDFEFMPDGSMIVFMRSNWYGTTGEEQSPMYFARSTDMGRTWSAPERFAELGTAPQIARLKNGAYAVMYGRPGLFVRVCEDESGLRWAAPVELLTAGDRSRLANEPKESPSFHDWDGECGNGAFVPVSDDTALAIYGDFYWPDAQGVKRKTILCRKVRIARASAVAGK